MALNISAGAIRNPIPPIVLFIALIFAGLTAYFRLPINQLPNIEFPGFEVSVSQPGAAPSEMENQITQRVETALTGVQGVRRVTSTVRQGSSSTMVELQIGADVARAVDDARDAMTRIRSDLPQDILEPVITRMETAAEPIAYYAVEGGGMNEVDLSWFIDNDLSRELLAIPGVSQIQRTGGVNREVRIELDPQVLLSYGVTADEVSRQLRSTNIDMPGGRAQVGGQAQTIRTLGAAESVDELSATRIILPDGRAVRLDALGHVTDGSSELSQISRYNGQPAISFMISRAKGASEVKVFDAMEAKLKAVEKTYNVKFRLIGTSVEFIKGMHESSLEALLEGALLATLVVFLVLKDWRATVICAVAIPLSIIPTFAFIEPLGFTLNMMTFIALSLVAGVLVDDAIVEIENIVRHMRDGKKPYEASIEAADEIGLAVVATSATIIAVFLPVSFMGGTTTGQFFQQFGITVAIAVFISLLVARLITPMMAAHFLRKHEHDEKPGKLREHYMRVLAWAIANPWKTVGMGTAVFIASTVLAFSPLVPKAFIPRIDNGMVQASVEFPPGMTLLEADRRLRGIAEQARQIKEVRGTFIHVGGSEGAASSGSVTFQLVDRHQRKLSSYDVQQKLRPMLSGIPDLRISFQNFQGGGRGADITFSFVGADRAKVTAAAEHLVTQMKQLPDLADVRSSASIKRPEIQIRPRADEAALQGVSAASIATAARIATSGDIDQNLAKFNLGDRQVPIRVLLRPDARTDLDTIGSLRVRTSTGQTVRLDSVADVSFNVGEATVQRRDRQREITVQANVTEGEPGPALMKVMQLSGYKTLPQGVQIVAGGQTEEMAEFMAMFALAMVWGVLLVYFVLVLLFKDFYQPITILTAFPLSIGGAFIGLLVTQQPFSLFVGIGLIMLMGIVTKNSILLVDFTVESMHKGMSRNQALLEAGAKRARPIVMTTIAMSAGMIPAAAGWGVDGSLRQGMGVAVIGGLLISTLLSLIFVPAVFVLIDRLERKISPYFSKFSSTHEDKPHAHPAE